MEEKKKGWQKSGPGKPKLDYNTTPLNIRVPVSIKEDITAVVRLMIEDWKKNRSIS